MSKAFFDRLHERAKAIDSLLCVGLDPRVPEGVDADDVASWIVAENKRIIDASAALTLAYKPNIAFYEAHGESGMLALRSTLALIPEGIPVILDAKRGDIGATSQAYAQASFEHLNVDALTVSPYMGKDSLEPFMHDSSRGIFALCKTSNPGSNDFQTLALEKGQRLFEEVADLMVSMGPQIGLVIGATDTEAMASIRRRHQNVWFLAPGIGAQGATIAQTVEAGLNNSGMGLLLVVARSVTQATDPAAEVRTLVAEFRASRDACLMKAKKSLEASVSPLKSAMLRGLVDTACFKTGEFVLKSGIKSPFYVDLRRIMSDPRVLRLAGKAYASLIGPNSPLAGVKFDRIAGIPVAGLPLATAMSLETGIPMIFPRMQQKEHGTGNLVEGEFKAGERVLLLDDLITTGKSKIEALAILRAAGLQVDTLVVLLERGVQGRKDMDAEGVGLHSFAHITEFFPLLRQWNIIDDAMKARLEEFVASTEGK